MKKKTEVFTVTTPIEIIAEDIQDLLTTAFEGGSNHWYFIESFNYPEGETKESLELEYPHSELPLFEGGSLTITDNEQPPSFEPKTLDLEAIKKGLSLMSEKYHKSFHRFISDDYDADDADIFLQLCLFKDVIFG